LKIIHYLKGSLNKALIITPQIVFVLECFVDANFCRWMVQRNFSRSSCQHIINKNQNTDIFTKALPKVDFEQI
jgi:hypothetical protein